MKGPESVPKRKKSKMWFVAIPLAMLGLWVGAGFWMRRGVKEPAFETISKEGDFEIRKYGPLVVAVTDVGGNQREALNEGFRRLAGYIFGGNRSKSKIAMTAPVLAERAEKIAMTAPVSASANAEGLTAVTFTMPSGRSLEDLPIPNDERVRLEMVPERTVVAVTFAGSAEPDSVKMQTDRVIAWAKQGGRVLRGAAILAQYDPPFTLAPMRRNEVMFELEQAR